MVIPKMLTSQNLHGSISAKMRNLAKNLTRSVETEVQLPGKAIDVIFEAHEKLSSAALNEPSGNARLILEIFESLKLWRLASQPNQSGAVFVDVRQAASDARIATQALETVEKYASDSARVW